MILKLIVGAVIGGFLGYLYHKKSAAKLAPVLSHLAGMVQQYTVRLLVY